MKSIETNHTPSSPRPINSNFALWILGLSVEERPFRAAFATQLRGLQLLCGASSTP